MKPALNIAVSAARAAGQVILRNLNRGPDLKIHSKGVNDFVSEVDHYAEQEIISIIQKSYPSHAILAEESGTHNIKKDDKHPTWIIDPLDGTTNFLHGFPMFAVSIGDLDPHCLFHTLIPMTAPTISPKTNSHDCFFS